MQTLVVSQTCAELQPTASSASPWQPHASISSSSTHTHHTVHALSWWQSLFRLCLLSCVFSKCVKKISWHFQVHLIEYRAQTLTTAMSSKVPICSSPMVLYRKEFCGKLRNYNNNNNNKIQVPEQFNTNGQWQYLVYIHFWTSGCATVCDLTEWAGTAYVWGVYCILLFRCNYVTKCLDVAWKWPRCDLKPKKSCFDDEPVNHEPRKSLETSGRDTRSAETTVIPCHVVNYHLRWYEDQFQYKSSK